MTIFELYSGQFESQMRVDVLHISFPCETYSKAHTRPVGTMTTTNLLGTKSWRSSRRAGYDEDAKDASSSAIYSAVCVSDGEDRFYCDADGTRGDALDNVGAVLSVQW